MNITFISDFTCPFCYIGFTQLQEALKQRSHVKADIGSLPFQLDSTAPEAGEPFAEFAARRFGEDADRMFEHVSNMGRAHGLEFRFDQVCNWPNTLKAHQLMSACPTEKRPDLYQALFKAYFTDGENIGDQETLFKLAESVGIELEKTLFDDEDLAAQTQRLLQSTQAIGVTGVPVFIFEEEHSVAGVQGVNGLLSIIDTIPE